jgi:hypothetical protein
MERIRGEGVIETEGDAVTTLLPIEQVTLWSPRPRVIDPSQLSVSRFLMFQFLRNDQRANGKATKERIPEQFNLPWLPNSVSLERWKRCYPGGFVIGNESPKLP